MNMTNEVAVFGGGCFWCTEAIFQRVRGVKSVQSGYAGGVLENPTYAQVSKGKTGHAEVVRIEYDPSVISYKELLDIFFHVHDPTTLNRQGSDVGPQYRSIILTTSRDQEQAAIIIRQKLEETKEFAAPIVTTIAPLTTFYPADISHADYYARNMQSPYCQLVIAPKITKLLSHYSDKVK